jgi:tRNA 2-thiouridine synthesizing protein A
MTSSSPSCSPPTSSSPGDALPGEAPGTAIDATLDLAGEVCPFTFVRAKLALEALPIGAVLRVIVDHEPARRNVPRSATEWGQAVLAVTELGELGELGELAELADPADPAGSRPRWAIDLRKRVP